jgi:pyruvate dehydrogenase E2 component (dihydrolipoamide acetyltransferase)
MPQMGYDMREGTLVRWLKQEGDSVQTGEPLAEIETDKAIIEMQAYASGVLRVVVASAGDTIPVGQVIGVIATADEEIPQGILESGLVSPIQPVDSDQVRNPVDPVGKPKTTTTSQSKERVRASPIARRIAQEHQLELGQIQGSGPNGRILEEDVLARLDEIDSRKALDIGQGKAADSHPEELSRMRRAIARLTTQAKQEIPHYYVTAEVNMDLAMETRHQLNEEFRQEEGRISVNDLIIKACALALTKHPILNSSYAQDHLMIHSRINIGIAVALDSGLLVPVVTDCDQKSLQEISRAARAVIQRANENRLSEEEYTGGTFSISNLGIYEVDSFTAIIFPPQAAVLAVGTVKQQPVAVNGNIKLAQVMKATVSVDHRVADGAQAAQFLMEIKRLLEHPVALLL